MNPNDKLVDLVEQNGNRMTRGEAIDALEDQFGGRERAEKGVDAIVGDSDRLVTDRFGGKDHIERVVY